MAFLRHLYNNELPVSDNAMRIVREILIQPPGVVVNATGEHPFDAPWPAETVASAKTGSTSSVAIGQCAESSAGSNVVGVPGCL
jgi:hypothetical protein